MAHALARAGAGDLVGALAAWRGALEGGAAPELVARARPLLERVEGRGRRTPAAPPPHTEPPDAAWAHAWAGDLAAARRLADEGADDPSTLGLRGALDVLERRPERGIALLDRAISAGCSQELVLHRVRGLIQLGRLDEARRALADLGDGDSFARRVLGALIEVRWGRADVPFSRWCRRVAASEVLFNGFFSIELPLAVGKAELHSAFESPEALAACLERLLDRMAGNLGPSPTLAEVDAAGTRRFVRLELPRTSRAKAVAALTSVQHVGAAGAEVALDALLARHPRSVHALTYRGELLLWLGRYADAWWSLLAARRIERARWTEIGMVAVLTLTGRTRLAGLMARHTARHFPPIPGGTLLAYRGALLRRIGDLRGAIVDLREAVARKPTRVGARIELCMVLREAGLRAEAVEHAAELVRNAAPLFVDAADACGRDWRAEPALLVSDPVLHEALRAMRGNRSSSIVTWVDRRGVLRLLERREILARDALDLLASFERSAPRRAR